MIREVEVVSFTLLVLRLVFFHILRCTCLISCHFTRSPFQCVLTYIGADVLDGVQSCVDAGAKVISMSLGCANCYLAVEDEFYNDVYDQNVLVIAAAGNSGSVIDHFPSGYPAVMSVASLDSDGTLSSFSTRNDQTEIAGPGRLVKSTIPDDTYASYSGTSMAS